MSCNVVGAADREGERVSPHPLIERAKDREVRQSNRFRDAAEKLGAEGLRKEWEEEVASAPRRHPAGKRYLAPRRRPPARLGDAQDQLALALLRHAVDPARALALPDGSAIQLVGCRVPLRTAPADSKQPEDPNRGVGDLDLLGVSDAGRLAVIALAHVEPDAARTGTGETPLRALLEGLASAAIAWANRDALREEIAAACAREVGDEPPLLLLLGAPRYWDLCRRRAAQKGAAWIHQMDRLAREIEGGLGVRVLYLALEPVGRGLDAEGWPALAAPPRIVPAWDEFAGRVRPKPPPRPKQRKEPEETIVAGDLSRPIRSYAMSERYQAGDRVAHPLFGEGVVQGPVGPGKIKVRFEGQPRVLVHERLAR
jgi:hypothetical protein